MPQSSSSLSSLTVPLNHWRGRTRTIVLLLAVAVATVYAILVSRLLGVVVADVPFYLRMASGDTLHIPQPFASRQLGPAIVRLLAWLLHWPVPEAFVLQGVVSLIVTLTIVFWAVLRSAAPRWVLAAVIFVPFWPQLYVGLQLPDLWYAAVLAVFLLFLARRNFLAAALMLFPLMVSRESTSLTLACLLIAGWRPLRWPGRLLAVASSLAGSALVGRLTAHNPGNAEHLPQSIYMLAKVPWNFLRNVLGIVPWSNVNRDMCAVPIWQHNLHIGTVHAIGVCGFSAEQPRDALAAALSAFGLLLLLALFLLVRSWRCGLHPYRDGSPLLRFSLVYGGISLLLAPTLGAWATRLFGYGWPFCLIAAPLLFAGLLPFYGGILYRKAPAALAFLAIHLAICASGSWLPAHYVDSVLVALNLAGFGLLRWLFGPTIPNAAKTPQSNPQGEPAAP